MKPLFKSNSVKNFASNVGKRTWLDYFNNSDSRLEDGDDGNDDGIPAMISCSTELSLDVWAEECSSDMSSEFLYKKQREPDEENDSDGDEEWNESTKSQTIQDIQTSLNYLESITDQLRDELTFKNDLMIRRFRKEDGPAESVELMKSILKFEAHRVRVLYATSRLEKLLQMANEKPLSRGCAPKVNFLSQLHDILHDPAPPVALTGFQEIYEEIKVRAEAVSVLKEKHHNPEVLAAASED